MQVRSWMFVISPLAFIGLGGCSSGVQDGESFEPVEIIDLGTLITEDLPERVWGKALLAAGNYSEQNSFRVIHWQTELSGEQISGSNSYFTLFNHGGPHVDAPIHVGLGDGVDGYSVEQFSGPLKVFDVAGSGSGRTVGIEVFRGQAEPGDVVLIYTAYVPPQTDEALPEVATLTIEAAEYLAGLPIRAFGTDAMSADSPQDTEDRGPSVHKSFLSRRIPAYEQLVNVDQLLGRERMYFVGPPLNIPNGDGMLVRPMVFVY